jgi:hypothetical protein
MSKHNNCNVSKSGSIQLVPQFISKEVIINKLENGFLIELKEGIDLDSNCRSKQTLIAESQKKAHQILEDFLKD